MMILPPVTPVMPIDPTRVYELVSANTEAVKAVLFLLGLRSRLVEVPYCTSFSDILKGPS